MNNKKLKVTFDSNVWEKIIEKEDELYSSIYEVIINKKILPFISEKIFIYEYFPKKTRQQKFSSLKSDIQIKEKSIQDKIQINIEIMPSKLNYDYKNQILLEKLNKAIKIGFKLIKLPRIGEPNPEQSLQIKKEWYSYETNFEQGFKCARFIEEELKAGFYFVKQYCYELNISISEFLKNSSQYISTKKFSKILAEWADGDTIAAHYGNNNDIFCTNDFAKNAGQSSILSEKNRKILSEKFNITFATPKELLNLLI